MKTYILAHDEARRRAIEAVKDAPDGYAVKVGPSTRSLEQNSALWPVLTALSEQLPWYGERLTPEEYKDLLTAALKRQRSVPGIDGGFVILGQSTSKMDKRTFSDLLDLAHAFANEKGVKLEQ